MKVVGKQTNSKNCIICGMENNGGVKAPFYNMVDGSVASLFKFLDNHQSYPERAHGGMITAMLDELMGRALWVNNPTEYAVTANISIKFRKPVPLNTELKARAYITKMTSRLYIAKGELFDNNDVLLAEGESTYIKLSTNQISEKMDEHSEMIYDIKDSITDIDFPEIKVNE